MRARPRLDYPADLPVSAHHDELLAALREHQVVVVAGETGSGKSTQLPKMALELALAEAGGHPDAVERIVGHTQPRRIAARAVAERLAEETGVELGHEVGYAVRFTDRVGPRTLVKVCTDGLLLAEIARDPDLRRYGTVVVDEAHERSLNVDFLLGYLHRLLPRRPDLRVVITSATIDPQRFADHFASAVPAGQDVPVIEVSGRTYPVEVRYRPFGVAPDDERDQVQAVIDALDELELEPPGDALVFLSGEREIRDTADALAGHVGPGTEVLPLFGRLSAAEQHRVFAPHDGRRVVLATNVAETSLTVPGVRYVVDAGTARISRYSLRTKVQRLPIEPVSQASADQRAGRCGRVADGVAIRLYPEADYLERPRFTDPEILRTNLAAVLLQMAALRLGDVEDFPFLDPPDPRQVRDGRQLLHELGAVEPGRDGTDRLTSVGRQLARLPVDPRIGRMVVEADRLGCLADVLVVAAGLSIVDPRERPLADREAADAQHARFADPTSDFLALLNLWGHLQRQQRELSSSRFRRMCRDEHLHYLRVREWQDLHGQLRQVVRSLRMTPGTVPDGPAADPDAVHRALLAGLLSHVGRRDDEADGRRRDYLGARAMRFAVAPGSSLFRSPPRWVMVNELVETTRLWGRTAARVQPEWVEAAAGHLVQRSYAEPRWDPRRGAVVADETVTLYGIPLVSGRTVGYGRIDPVLSRELFLRHALVEGDWEPPPSARGFLGRNAERLGEVADLEARSRRRDLRPSDDVLLDFFDARVPAEVVSTRHFVAWWKRASRESPDLLDLTDEVLRSGAGERPVEELFPDEWRHGGLALPVTYRFEPGAPDDGVTVHVPLELLPGVAADRTAWAFDWQVPGLREDKVVALLRSLPKALRRSFVPAPNWATTVLPRLGPGSAPMTDALAAELLRMTGVRIEPGDWNQAAVPPWLDVTFVVERVGRRGRHVVGRGKDLGALAAELAPRVRESVAELVSSASVERSGLTTFPAEGVPRTYPAPGRAGQPAVTGYPALVDEGGDTVAVRVLATPAEQARAMRLGTRRLLLLGLPSPWRSVLARLDNRQKLALGNAPHGSTTALLDDVLAAVVDRRVAAAGGPAWESDGFDRLATAVGDGLVAELGDRAEQLAELMAVAAVVRERLAALDRPSLADSLADARAQLDGLLVPEFVTAWGADAVPDLLRWVRGLQRRLEVLPDQPARDRQHLATVHALEDELVDAVASLPPDRRAVVGASPGLARVRRLLQELRVSLFAQSLGTAEPVSPKRVRAAIAALTVTV